MILHFVKLMQQNKSFGRMHKRILISRPLKNQKIGSEEQPDVRGYKASSPKCCYKTLIGRPVELFANSLYLRASPANSNGNNSIFVGLVIKKP